MKKHHFFVPTQNKLILGSFEEWKEDIAGKIQRNALKPADLWRALLGSPQLHWKDGHSAKELAHLWEKERLPLDVQRVIDNFNTNNPEITCFKNLEVFYAFPEFQIPLPGGNTNSQADIYIIAKGDRGLISIAVEGKAGEDFSDKTVEQWLHDKKNSPNSKKPERLNYLADIFSLDYDNLKDLKYQLLHRTADPIIEGSKIGVKSALMLVHSFKEYCHFEDYQLFAETLGFAVPVMRDAITGPVKVRFEGNEVDLYMGWVCSEIKNYEGVNNMNNYATFESNNEDNGGEALKIRDATSDENKFFTDIRDSFGNSKSYKGYKLVISETSISIQKGGKTISSLVPKHGGGIKFPKSFFYKKYLDKNTIEKIMSYFEKNGIDLDKTSRDTELRFKNADVFKIDKNGSIVENHIINILKDVL